jgi:hypothetical protein
MAPPVSATPLPPPPPIPDALPDTTPSGNGGKNVPTVVTTPALPPPSALPPSALPQGELPPGEAIGASGLGGTGSEGPAVPMAPAEPSVMERILLSKAVPKAFFLSVGWQYTVANALPLSGAEAAPRLHGINIDGGLLWQVRGFDGVTWPAWVGFMPSFYYLFGGQNAKDALGLGYGIYVKHALFPKPRYRFFLAYGLGATQVFVREISGRSVGHLTRLGMGVDVRLTRRVHAMVELSYRFFMLPNFELPASAPGSHDFHTVNVQAGLWYGH